MSASRVIVVGGGFAGVYAARTLERLLPPTVADITMISATDHLCYSPLLPEVAAGRLDPRRVAVPLRAVLRRARILQGVVDHVDVEARTLQVECGTAEPLSLTWDRLVLTTGSVTRDLPIPGVARHAFGLKTVLEAQELHDHVLRQLEAADATTDPAERQARLTFVAVGAGYTGTETAAQLQRMTTTQVSLFPRLSQQDLTWHLVDLSDHILPELGPRLGRSALKVIEARGMRVRLGVTVERMTADSVRLTDGTVLGAHTVVWTVGVTPPPLVQRLGLPVSRGRLRVDPRLRLADGVWAAGDTAAAPDPFGSVGADYPPTAQHAQRQGVVLGRNVAASLGCGRAGRYRHRDLGLVADLGGRDAVARPLGIPLTGLTAKVVTKAYHLYALPASTNRLRVAADWLVNLCSRPIPVQLGTVPLLGRTQRDRRSPDRSSLDEPARPGRSDAGGMTWTGAHVTTERGKENGDAVNRNGAVQVTLVRSRIDADLVVGMLQAHGISAVVATDDAGGAEPQFQLTGGVRVLVSADRLAEASELIREAESAAR